MVSPVSPLEGAPNSNSVMQQQSSIVAPSAGSVRCSCVRAIRSLKPGGRRVGLTRNNGARVDQETGRASITGAGLKLRF